MAGSVGRPRKNRPRRQGRTAREEILDAAAELFTTQGFATTSTHQIADAVGIRQASLYYHFPSKTEIFLTLLRSTLAPAVELAEKLGGSAESAPMRLWALVAAEAEQLLSTPWNLGKLYHLPVASSPEFADYHAERSQMEEIFASVAAEIVGIDDPRRHLPFHLALAVIDMRENDGQRPATDSTGLSRTAVMLADAALRVLGAELPDERVATTLALLAR